MGVTPLFLGYTRRNDMVINAREVAINILTDINIEGAFSNISINKYFQDNDINTQDESFIREIVYGVLENKMYLDYIISKASNIRLKKIHPTIMEILRIGIYQLIFMDRVPESAAVNESVNLAKKFGHKGTIGFVNGVLRSITRDKDKFMWIDSKDKLFYLSTKYSHPQYMVKRWIEEFGVEFTEKLLKANNTKPKLNIRVNTLKTNKEELKKILSQKGYKVEEGKIAKDCLIIDNPSRITELTEFKNGHFTIQDESSMLVGQIMDPKLGSFVLDVCSAPGGKSTHIAQIMENKGRILARDVFSHKMDLIHENANRLGIDIIETQEFDALKRDEVLINKVDYLLVDAPCSGLGLLRRKPEIKWNRKEEDIFILSKLQTNILGSVADYVKSGGVLIYSTCTIGKAENMDIVNKFLTVHPEYKLESVEQLYPHIHETDGFFIAKMIKE